MAAKKGNNVTKYLSWAGVVAVIGAFGYFVYDKVSGFKALVDGVRAQVTDVDLVPLASLTPKLPVTIGIDNNSKQPLTLNNIIATLYKVNTTTGALDQIATNPPVSNITLTPNQRTEAKIEIVIPALSAITTIGSGFLTRGQEQYELHSSVVVANQTIELDPYKFSV